MKKYLFIILTIIIVLIITTYLFFLGKEKYTCWSKWGSTSIEHRVKKLHCQVKHPTMGWIPESSFRVTEQILEKILFPALHIAKEFKQKGFDRLDTSRRGVGSVWVDANQLIDLCLAFECAAEGDVSNLEYSLSACQKSIDKLENEIWRLKDILISRGIDF